MCFCCHFGPQFTVASEDSQKPNAKRIILREKEWKMFPVMFSTNVDCFLSNKKCKTIGSQVEVPLIAYNVNRGKA